MSQKDNLISRAAAIDALGERPMVWVGSDYELGARNQYDADVLALETVPSAQPSSSCGHEKDAQPERKRGRWISYRCDMYECSECGYRKDSQKKWNYCPNCGARMGEE